MATELEIDEVEIVMVKARSGLLGFASLVLNRGFYIGCIAIHGRPNGDFRLVFPCKNGRQGNRIPIAHPVTREVGQALTEAVVAKLREVAPQYF